jgi:cellulose synthase/poly-beta-1,6-N-acetylglucosamine synthase-like glycosyltransferase
MSPLAIHLSLVQQTTIVAGAFLAGLFGVFTIDFWIMNFLSLTCRIRTVDWLEIDKWPRVSIHLPLYNEKNVASRLIEACLGLDYPKESLEIIVLDDSTDGTTEIVERYRKKHPELVKVLHRNERRGFKGGALNEALDITTADFVAVFDADEVPPRNFLKLMIPRLVLRPDLAFVQARKAYFNSDSSWITKGMALGMDVYSFIGQAVRSSVGLLAHFSGSAAIFRRRAIEQVGGWSGDTLAEDLDLSIRLQLAGWKYQYAYSITCLGEIPTTFSALKEQQFRWAKGYSECLRKYSSSIIRSRRLSPFKRVEALVHLGMYLTYPLMIIGTIVGVLNCWVFPLPVLLFGLWTNRVTWFTFGISLVNYTAPLAAALLTISEMPGRRVLMVSRLLYLGIIAYGLTISNTRAVIEGLIGKKSEFLRTPKVGANPTLNELDLLSYCQIASSNDMT